MAKEPAVPPPPPPAGDAEKAKARQWFKKADDLREKRDYDYAIECYITGLNFWPDAIDDGHAPLWALAIQRMQAGGKKVGMIDAMKLSTSAKDPKLAMLNAAALAAKDPPATHVDALVKNAIRAGLPAVAKFYAPKVMDSIRKDKKPNAARLKAYRQALIEGADAAGALGDTGMSVWLFERAVESVEYQLAHAPGDAALRDEQRDLAGRLTITRGNYSNADSFRDSMQGAAEQQVLQEKERMKQGESSYQSALASLRKDVAANPDSAGKINALVDHLLKVERQQEEDEAMAILSDAYARLDNYSFKLRADDARLRQLNRQTRTLEARAAASGSEDDAQQMRLAAMEEAQVELDVFRERAKMYPTDLRLKYRLGQILFRLGDLDEAIPMLQSAQADPRTRVRCQLLIGRAFLDKDVASEAVAIIREAQEAHEIKDDDLAKELMYWLGRASEADGKIDDAKAAYGRLLRLEYNYADARARLEKIR